MKKMDGQQNDPPRVAPPEGEEQEAPRLAAGQHRLMLATLGVGHASSQCMERKDQDATVKK